MNKWLLILTVFINQLALANDNPHSLLTACWTEAQLKGTPHDKVVQNTHPDNSPPKNTQPTVIKTELNTHLSGSIRSVVLPNNEKYIALSFDLCEQANQKTGYDAEIINYLRDNKIKATLFAGGKWMRSHPEKTKQLMAEPLFELANHSWTHGNLRLIHGKALTEQILWTQAQYELLRTELLNSQCAAPFKNQAELLIPPVPELFRFPFGTCDTEALTTVNHYGLAAIQWNIVTADPVKSQSASAIKNTILNQAKSGAIIVAHANGKGWHTAQALPSIINELHKRGFQFVKISELLAMGKPVVTNSCYELKPNDNKRYDKLFGKGTQ